MADLRFTVPGLAALLLQACASLNGSSYSLGPYTITNIKSASDLAGGPRQDIIFVTDSRDGHLLDTLVASGPGTLQALAGAVGTIVTAGGQVAGSALLRPTKNNTTATVNGGTGTANSSSSGSTTSSVTGSASSSATGTGGSVSP